MAIFEIKKFNDSVLRSKCEEVKKVDKEIEKIINDMADTMERNRGIGLAAPQVGTKKRIIVVKTDFEKPDVFALVNPKIVKKSPETETREEGCLSFPGIFLKIKRAKEIVIEGLNIKDERVKIRASGFLAEVFQHETDHLDGVLFFDRLPFFQRIKFKFKLKSLK